MPRTTTLFLCLIPLSASAADVPSFLLINIDDLGYADVARFGSTINRTPNLDQLAAEGRRLTCRLLPSRA